MAQTRSADLQTHCRRLHEEGAGLTCQFDVVPEALSSSGGSKPQHRGQTPPDQLASQAILEATYAAVVTSWGLMTHGLPYALTLGCSLREAMPTGRTQCVHIGPRSRSSGADRSALMPRSWY